MPDEGEALGGEDLLERQARQAALRADVGTALSGGGALHDILQRCAEAMVRHLNAAFARIWTLNEEEDVLELQASAGIYTHLDGPHSRVPVGELKIGLIAQERQPHLTNVVAGDRRVSDKEWARREGMVAFAGYPLVVEGRVVGVMAMFARQELAQDTLEALASVAAALAQGIERKRVEEALEQSEDRLRLAVESAGLGIWDFDPTTGEVRADDRAKAMLGISPGARMDYEAFLAGVHPDDQDRVDRLVRRAIDPESGGEYEVGFRTAGLEGGTERWVEARGRALFDEAGRAYRFTGTVLDMTERRRAEEVQSFLAEASEVLSSSLSYRTTLSSVARLAVPILADWCAVDVLGEGGFVERLVVEHEDPQKVALALKLRERYPTDLESPGGVPHVLRTGRPELYPEVTDEMLEATARDEEHLRLLREIGFTSAIIVPMTARGRTLGAVTLVASESGRRFAEADLELAEELARRAALAVDNATLYEEAQREIAEREWAQAELRSSRDELEAILAGIADGVTAQDTTGRVIYANEAAARMVGYPSGRAFVEAPLQEVLERFEVLDEEGRPFPLENLPGRKALQGEVGAEEVLCFRVLETGEERWSIVKAVPIFEERGKVRMAVNIFRDITERKRSEDALREIREAERRRLARDLHDGVLQDLSYITAAMGVLMLEVEGTRLEEEFQRAIDAVRRAAQGLRDAVNDLRLEEEWDRPFPELVESLVQRNRAMARGHEISLKIEEGFPSSSLGDAGTQLLRIIQEALTNARRHSGATSVAVTLGMEGSDLVAEVSDDGQGFRPRTASGVGLSSMRERAAAMGAKLEIGSEVGQGTRVRLRVPVPQKG